MAAWRKTAGIVFAVVGVIVVLTSSVVKAGEEILWTGFIVQVAIGASMVIAGTVLMVLSYWKP